MAARGRPRILIDALAYDPHDGGFATALRGVLDSCREIPEIEFVVAHHTSHGDYFESLGLGSVSLVFPYKLRFFASFAYLPWLARTLEADAVHCEISALPVGLGVPGSVTAHDLYFMSQPESAGRSVARRFTTEIYWRRLFVRSLKRATVVKAISETTGDDIRRLHESANVTVISPRIETECGPPSERRWPADGEPLRILFLGSVVPRKNLELLLEALKLVDREWRLDIAGNLWWGKEVLDEAAGDPRIEVHGYVEDAERDLLLDRCHVLVAPSLYEGFCYPVAEAMTRGALVLTSDISAFREYVPDECRFDIFGPEPLAAALSALSCESYERLRGLCRTAAQRFTPAAHVEAHRRLFSELAGVTA
ncbi:MAG TPA: glycosyltransferase [Dehalococcoidia bacterium]|nr:glycosyltransferase [Dehalococcoidia bacterium]